jgi:hypothetical protein
MANGPDHRKSGVSQNKMISNAQSVVSILLFGYTPYAICHQLSFG